MLSCLSSSCRRHIMHIILDISIQDWYVLISSYASTPFIFNLSYGVWCWCIRMRVFLLFYFMDVSFLSDFLYLFYQTKISTLMDVPSEINGKLTIFLPHLLDGHIHSRNALLVVYCDKFCNWLSVLHEVRCMFFFWSQRTCLQVRM